MIRILIYCTCLMMDLPWLLMVWLVYCSTVSWNNIFRTSGLKDLMEVTVSEVHTFIVPQWTLTFIYTDQLINEIHKFVFTNVKETLHTLIRVIFSPVFICHFYTCKHLCYILYLPRQCCARREIIWDIGTCPALNLPADNKGKRDRNKTTANISLL